VPIPDRYRLLLSEYILGGVDYKLLRPQTTIQDCLYMSVVTVTTVGYEEVIDTAANPLLRAYTLLLILAGVGVMLYAVSVVTAYIVEGDLNQKFWNRRMQRRIDSMKEHFIICGAGETGRRVIEELAQTKRDFVVIDPDPKTVAAFRSEYSDPILQGVSDDQDTLKAAGVDRATGAVVALPNDRDNLVTTLSIRMLNPSIRIVTKEINSGMPDRLKQAGADAVVNPGTIGGLRLVSELVRPSIVMIKEVENQPPDLLAILVAGGFFGEIALLAESPKTATVRAAIPCTMLRLRRRYLETLMDATPDLRSSVHRAYKERLAALESLGNGKSAPAVGDASPA
jgi:voltage-gated potassium channel Kch